MGHGDEAAAVEHIGYIAHVERAGGDALGGSDVGHVEVADFLLEFGQDEDVGSRAAVGVEAERLAVEAGAVGNDVDVAAAEVGVAVDVRGGAAAGGQAVEDLNVGQRQRGAEGGEGEGCGPVAGVVAGAGGGHIEVVGGAGIEADGVEAGGDHIVGVGDGVGVDGEGVDHHEVALRGADGGPSDGGGAAGDGGEAHIVRPQAGGGLLDVDVVHVGIVGGAVRGEDGYVLAVAAVVDEVEFELLPGAGGRDLDFGDGVEGGDVVGV